MSDLQGITILIVSSTLSAAALISRKLGKEKGSLFGQKLFGDSFLSNRK